MLFFGHFCFSTDEWVHSRLCNLHCFLRLCGVGAHLLHILARARVSHLVSPLGCSQLIWDTASIFLGLDSEPGFGYRKTIATTINTTTTSTTLNFLLIISSTFLIAIAITVTNTIAVHDTILSVYYYYYWYGYCLYFPCNLSLCVFLGETPPKRNVANKAGAS